MTSRREHTLPDGTVIELREIPPLIIARIAGDTTGKPKVPVVEVRVHGQTQREENPEDPSYVQKLAQWETEKNFGLLRRCILMGVVTEPPEEEAMFWSGLFETDDKHEIKYLWIASKLTTEESIAAFSETVMSQSIVTREGLTEAADSFRGNH